ncbi:hypothetical protein AGMMS49992_30560 [Clostridia bacterium]|nr:hypothetical protein AGMMS49992_30560 [Clostridia bacterium]
MSRGYTIWESDAQATAIEFKENGFEEIVYIYEGSNAWDTLKIFQDEGYVINGMVTIQPVDDEFPNRKQKPRNGLLLKLI